MDPIPLGQPLNPQEYSGPRASEVAITIACFLFMLAGAACFVHTLS